MSFEHPETPATNYEETFDWKSDAESAKTAEQITQERLIGLGWTSDQAVNFSQAVKKAIEDSSGGGDVTVQFRFTESGARVQINGSEKFNPATIVQHAANPKGFSPIDLGADRVSVSPGELVLEARRNDNPDSPFTQSR